MNHRFLGLFRNERGSVLIIVALGFTVFLGFVAIVTDLGLLYVKQNKLAHAVDAAALAGAQELPADPYNAVTVAKKYAQRNGVDQNQVQVTISVDKRKLTVNTNQDVNLIFAQFIGKEKGTVGATATAKVASIKAVKGAVPFSVMEQELHYGEEYVLKEGAHEPSRDGIFWISWFGALDLTGGGGGSSEYKEMVKNGYPEKISIGDIVEMEAGNMAGPTCQGAEYRIDSCNHVPGCTWDDFDPDCQREIYVPIVKPISWQESIPKEVEVVGFAAFFLKEIDGTGNNQSIVGYFIQDTISSEIDDTLENYGLQGVKLIN